MCSHGVGSVDKLGTPPLHPSEATPAGIITVTDFFQVQDVVMKPERAPTLPGFSRLTWEWFSSPKVSLSSGKSWALLEVPKGDSCPTSQPLYGSHSNLNLRWWLSFACLQIRDQTWCPVHPLSLPFFRSE